MYLFSLSLDYLHSAITPRLLVGQLRLTPLIAKRNDNTVVILL